MVSHRVTCASGKLFAAIPCLSANFFHREELDREQLAIVEASDCERGLGVYGDFEHETDWHGGRVLQIARLVPSQSPDADTPYRIQLEVPEYQKASTRFARFLGSRRMLRLSINPDLIYREEEQIRQFLTQKFVLCGRTFRPLKPKDGKVYMVEVSEDFDRVPRDDEGDHRRLTFEQIIEWHNPMEFNLNQVRLVAFLFSSIIYSIQSLADSKVR